MSPWIGIGSFLGGFGVLLTGLRLLQLHLRLPAEVARKLPHVTMGLAALSLPWLFDELWPVLLLAGLNLGLLLALRHPTLRGGPGQVLHGVSRRSLGDLAYPMAVAALFVLSSGEAVFYVPPLLLLALADAAATLVGQGCGRRRYRTADGHRTLEGSAAFLAIALISVVAVPLQLNGLEPLRSLVIAVVVASVATLIEAGSWRGLDNLFVPLAGYWLLKLLLAPPAVFPIAPLLVGGMLLLRRPPPLLESP